MTWNTQTSNFGTSTILSVAFGNGLWLAGGADRTLRTSTDAVNWNTQTTSFTGTGGITALAYGTNTWVAGLNSGGQLRTNGGDGVTWTTQVSNFGTSGIQGVAYGDGIYVAVGSAGQIRTSRDTVHSIVASTTVTGYTWWMKT